MSEGYSNDVRGGLVPASDSGAKVSLVGELCKRSRSPDHHFLCSPIQSAPHGGS